MRRGGDLKLISSVQGFTQAGSHPEQQARSNRGKERDYGMTLSGSFSELHL